MARLAAARPLTLAQRKPANAAAVLDRAHARFAFGTASAADDAEIRTLLRDTRFPGAISLSLEREPDASIAAVLDGDVRHTIVARERSSSALAAIASLGIRTRFVNGEECRVGYFGQLRIAPGFRRARGLIEGGFEFCRALHDRCGPPIYLASVVRDNVAAMRLLERGISGAPRFQAVDRFITLAISARRAAPFSEGAVETISGTECDISALVQCVRRTGRRYQFSPAWTAEELASPNRLPGLHLSDFIVSRANGTINGCAALWDQRGFKQVVVRGYSPALGRWRWLINVTGGPLGLATLPPPGSRLEFAYLSHLAADDDDPAVASALVRAACVRARQRGSSYVVLGLPARSPHLDVLRRAFSHRTYESILYAGAWPGGFATLDSLDGRPCNPELAIL